jgi:hypothetical protein
MKITPIADSDRLFSIENILPDNLVQQMLNLEWMKLPWERQPGQEHWPRRKIITTSCLQLVQYTEIIDSQITQIAEKINQPLGIGHTTWWLDEPGFHVPIHMDNVGLQSAMQMFWIAPGPDYGTAFYHSNNQKDIWNKFKFQANTGYIMVNQPKERVGDRPWHGMLNTLPDNTYRVTSYTNFVTWD